MLTDNPGRDGGRYANGDGPQSSTAIRAFVEKVDAQRAGGSR
jgi:hypothetical protein